jgi:6-phosphogluconate dehydrogenase
MVHNGIEYADMQLIAEAYGLLRVGLKAPAHEIADVFKTWNKGDLESFLVETTADVLAHIDPDSGKDFVDVALDQAEQKGTGRWTVQSALDLGVPITGIAEATFARSLSGHADQRGPARAMFGTGIGELNIGDRDAFVEDVRKALYASKVVAYAQGFDRSKPAPRPSAGTWTAGRWRASGAADASSAPGSSTVCARYTMPTPNCPHSWWHPTSPT